jgi:hypothetical protein
MTSIVVDYRNKFLSLGDSLALPVVIPEIIVAVVFFLVDGADIQLDCFFAIIKPH